MLCNLSEPCEHFLHKLSMRHHVHAPTHTPPFGVYKSFVAPNFNPSILDIAPPRRQTQNTRNHEQSPNQTQQSDPKQSSRLKPLPILYVIKIILQFALAWSSDQICSFCTCKLLASPVSRQDVCLNATTLTDSVLCGCLP